MCPRCLPIAALLLVSMPAFAADRFERARTAGRDYVVDLQERGRIPGLQVAVAVDGDVVWSEAFGHANLEQGVPVTTETKFRIASISKALTGTVAARLARHDRLDLDAPVRQYVPSYPATGGDITARQLAGHLSGIRDYRDGEMERRTHYRDLESALAIFCHDPLQHLPGKQRSYTTYGFTLLGVVMERATGRDFETLMHDELLGPLGMTKTVPDVQHDIIPQRASFYTYDDAGRVCNAHSTDHSYKLPGGGYLSTAEDLVKFGIAMTGAGDHLDRATIDLALARTPTTGGRDWGYGMGWELSDHDGDRIATHRGTQPGARSYLYVNPRRRTVVVILTNVTKAPIDRDEARHIAADFVAARK